MPGSDEVFKQNLTDKEILNSFCRQLFIVMQIWFCTVANWNHLGPDRI